MFLNLLKKNKLFMLVKRLPFPWGNPAAPANALSWAEHYINNYVLHSKTCALMAVFWYLRRMMKNSWVLADSMIRSANFHLWSSCQAREAAEQVIDEMDFAVVCLEGARKVNVGMMEKIGSLGREVAEMKEESWRTTLSPLPRCSTHTRQLVVFVRALAVYQPWVSGHKHVEQDLVWLLLAYS